MFLTPELTKLAELTCINVDQDIYYHNSTWAQSILIYHLNQASPQSKTGYLTQTPSITLCLLREDLIVSFNHIIFTFRIPY